MSGSSRVERAACGGVPSSRRRPAHQVGGSRTLGGRRALIAGSTTFGKGSVNALTPIGVGQGMYITIARWLTPDGHLIEQNGIEPDEYLSIHEMEMVGWAIDFLQSASTAAAFDP